MSSSSSCWSDESGSEVKEENSSAKPNATEQGLSLKPPSVRRLPEVYTSMILDSPKTPKGLPLFPGSPKAPEGIPLCSGSPKAPEGIHQVVIVAVQSPSALSKGKQLGDMSSRSILTSEPVESILPVVIEQLLSPVESPTPPLNDKHSTSGSRCTSRRPPNGRRSVVGIQQPPSKEFLCTPVANRRSSRNKFASSLQKFPLDERRPVTSRRLLSPTKHSEEQRTSINSSRKLSSCKLSARPTEIAERTETQQYTGNTQSGRSSQSSRSLKEASVLEARKCYRNESSKSNRLHDETPRVMNEPNCSTHACQNNQSEVDTRCEEAKPDTCYFISSTPMDVTTVPVKRNRDHHTDLMPETAKHSQKAHHVKKVQSQLNNQSKNTTPKTKDRCSARKIQIPQARRTPERLSDMKPSLKQATPSREQLHPVSSIHVFKRTIVLARLKSARSVTSDEALGHSTSSSCCESQISVDSYEKQKRSSSYYVPHRRACKDRARYWSEDKRNGAFHNVHTPKTNDSFAHSSKDSGCCEEMLSNNSSVSTNIAIPHATKKLQSEDIRKNWKQPSSFHKSEKLKVKSTSSKNNLPVSQGCQEADEFSESSSELRSARYTHRDQIKTVDVDFDVPIVHCKLEIFPTSDSRLARAAICQNCSSQAHQDKTNLFKRNKTFDTSKGRVYSVLTRDAVTQVDRDFVDSSHSISKKSESSSRSSDLGRYCSFCHMPKVNGQPSGMHYPTGGSCTICMPNCKWLGLPCRLSTANCASKCEAACVSTGDGNVAGYEGNYKTTPVSIVSNEPLKIQRNFSSENETVEITSGARVSKLPELNNVIKVSLQCSKAGPVVHQCCRTQEENKCSCFSVEDSTCKPESCVEAAQSKLQINDNKADLPSSYENLPKEKNDCRLTSEKYTQTASVHVSRNSSKTSISKSDGNKVSCTGVNALDKKDVVATEVKPKCDTSRCSKKEPGDKPLPRKPEAGTNPKRNRFGWLIPESGMPKQPTVGVLDTEKKPSYLEILIGGKAAEKSSTTSEAVKPKKTESNNKQTAKRKLGYLKATRSSFGRQKITTDQNRKRCVTGAPSRYFLTSDVFDCKSKGKKKDTEVKSSQKLRSAIKNNGNATVMAKAQGSTSDGINLPGHHPHISSNNSDGLNRECTCGLKPPCFSAQELAVLSSGDAKFLCHQTQSLNSLKPDSMNSSALKRAIQSIRRLLPSWRKKSMEAKNGKISVASSNTHLIALSSLQL